ncbi:MAG: PQQ-binding-like beta-propeller repeat protein [Planctomycetaceae bacterium]|nr:PQQ-binding-like beta-propeller repeat protein [Planctomycetaceae bacterium]
MKHIILSLLCLLLPCASLSVSASDNWTMFRGSTGQNHSTATGLPVKWNAENNENLAWKTEIPGSGWSSPIIWDDRIFLTSTTDEGKECRVISVDKNTGKILWNKIVFTQEPQNKHPKNSFATPTPATDGKNVYVVFGSGGFAALDFNGNIIWTNTELLYYSKHGLGTSPILYKDLLITAVNPSSREDIRLGWQDVWDKNFVLALDKNTGKERWRARRGLSRIGHSTPIVISVNGKDLLVSPAGNVIQGFNPENGELVWTVQSMGEPAVPSAAYGDGLVFMANSPSDLIRAVRPDGKGDCTATKIVWEVKRNVPTMASFLYVKPCLYTACDNGSFSAFDAATGELFWQKRLSGNLNPSPLYADGKIYVLSEDGTTTVLQPADDPKQEPAILSRNELGEHALASIAVSGKSLYIRTDKHLWRIGK